jgi:hypothetical protein
VTRFKDAPRVGLVLSHDFVSYKLGDVGSALAAWRPRLAGRISAKTFNQASQERKEMALENRS